MIRVRFVIMFWLTDYVNLWGIEDGLREAKIYLNYEGIWVGFFKIQVKL